MGAFAHGFGAGPRAQVLEAGAAAGKTALLAATVAAAEDRETHVLAAAPAEAEAGLEFVVLGDLLRRLEPSERMVLPAPQRQALEEALLLTERGAVAAGDHAIGLATLGMLKALSRTRAVIVAIDDDHWTDARSARALAFAAGRLGDAPVRFLIAREPGPHGLGPLLAATLGPGDFRSLAAGQTGRGLTASETLVADLVATGRSTKEVAATLCLSPRTVEGVLTRVYAKVGVHSRAELAHLGSAPRR